MDFDKESGGTTLILKNIPKEVKNLSEVLTSVGARPQEIRPFGRRRALLLFPTESEATAACDVLQELTLFDKKCNVSFFVRDKAKNKSNTSRRDHLANKAVQTESGQMGMEESVALPKISKYVCKLYACEGNLNFDQPPPPYLKYSYPRINASILDSICIALMSNTRFYTQVLHLMNRMNLEPPFGERKQKFHPPGEPREAATQTEDVDVRRMVAAKSETETELESSDEEHSKIQPINVKRKVASDEGQYKKKARLILHTLQKQRQKPVSDTKEKSLKDSIDTEAKVFEKPQKTIHHNPKIALNLIAKEESQIPEAAVVVEESPSTLTLPTDLNTQKLTPEQMREMAIFKDYNSGVPSNKLYIKNLAKNVKASDLVALYERYVREKSQLDVKVMQQGRMKGQAFVTFNRPEPDVDTTETDILSAVSKALEETNGFLLNEKPMVVYYGKQS